jgi:8-oxo-dGTP pyrophosphatase MutT (NUDIX family)
MKVEIRKLIAPMKDVAQREFFLESLRRYEAVFKEELTFRDRFMTLLEHQDAFERTHLPGHITGSAFIVSEDFSHTLLVHHAKLNRWLQPGGHADGDTNVTRVAMREANEETGLMNLTLIAPEIFDLDIHTIPERKDFPQHEHYDVRFLFTGSRQDTISVSEESHDVKWVALDELEKYNDEKSVLRLKEKALKLKAES